MLQRALKRLTSIPTPVIFAFSLAMAILLLWQQDALSSIRPAIRNADPWTIAAGLLLYLFGLALLCVRWNLLVTMVSGATRHLRASEAFITSVAVNYAAPLSLALPSRAYLTKRALGLGTAETASITFWEVASDLAVLAVGTLLWIVIGGWRGQPARICRVRKQTCILQRSVGVCVVGAAACCLSTTGIGEKP